MKGKQGNGGSTEEVTAVAVGEVETAVGWQWAKLIPGERGRRHWRYAEAVHTATLTHAGLHSGHIIKGHRSAQAVRKRLPCRPSTPEVASRL